MSQPRLTNAPWVEREAFIEAFETAYAADPDADFAAFVPPSQHPLRLPVLEELVRIDLEHHWLRGEPRWLEGYFHRFPELFEASAAVRTLAFEEFRLRRRAGHAVPADEYRQRFGIDPTRGIRDDLPDPALGPATPKPPPDRFAQVLATLPHVGDRFLGYQLTAELGAGAFGRVFLATSDKSRQPVAIKVVPLIGGEPPTLARLRHPHIVPVSAVHKTEAVQAVVMPYRGAVTLAHAQLTFSADSLPASGRALFDVHRPGLPLAPAEGTPLRAMLVQATYADTALWLIGQLADGLDHAHRRGFLHRDLKPANILIADDGTPMLLDFNLATDARRPDQPRTPCPGGTLPYMAPEQLDAFIGNRRAIDARADLYALGVILFHLLTGRMPYPTPHDTSIKRLAATLIIRLRPAPRVRSLNPAASSAADCLVHRLLQPDPDLRPPTAAALRDELASLVPHLPKRAETWRGRMARWFTS
jgi:eukaryotic-like serine/threonine-protein kinase